MGYFEDGIRQRIPMPPTAKRATTNFEKITKSPEAIAEYICLHCRNMNQYRECVEWLREKSTEDWCKLNEK